MPDIRNKETVEALAREYCTNGHNKTQAMITVGYNPENAQTGNGQKVFIKPRVIAAIEAIEAKDAVKMDLSRHNQHLKLIESFDIAKKAKNPAAMTSAVREQNEMLGYHRENAPNAEREAARLARMDDEERAERKFYARERCKDISRGKTVPIKAEGA